MIAINQCLHHPSTSVTIELILNIFPPQVNCWQLWAEFSFHWGCTVPRSKLSIVKIHQNCTKLLLLWPVKGQSGQICALKRYSSIRERNREKKLLNFFVSGFFFFQTSIMIDWVSIVRHSRRRFSNYVGTRAPIRIKKRRRTPQPSSQASSPHGDRHQYSCCCAHVSFSTNMLRFSILFMVSQ